MKKRSHLLGPCALMLSLASGCTPVAACQAAPKDERPWRAEVAFRAPDKLGGCVIGDFDPGHAGNEIAAVARDGSVYVVRRSGSAWTHELAIKTPGEMIQCAVGDVDPDSPGNELVLVGMLEGGEDDGGRGAAFVLTNRGEWKLEKIFEDVALIHGVCVGDLDPARPGDEILTVGYSERANLVAKLGSEWKSEEVAKLDGAGKNAVFFRGGAAVAATDGSVRVLRKGASGWTTDVLDRQKAGQSRIGSGGERLIVAGDDGSLALITDGVRNVIYREGDKLRGAVLADLDPSREGLEAATAGYEARIVVLIPMGTEWRSVTVFEDEDRFHHLAGGELIGGGGAELVACGYSGKVIVVTRDAP